MIELISVHLPKCAGVSFRQALERIYSPEAIYYDYDDHPSDPASPMNIDPDGFLKRHHREPSPELIGKKVVHGHFYVRKYELLKGCARIVFIRHPVERLISHYYFWLKLARSGHSLHEYVLDNNLSLLQFAQLPSTRYLYTRVYFREVDMKVFDFIGVFEDLPQETERLGRLLGKKIVLERANANPDPAYVDQRRRIMEDHEMVAALHASLAEDIRFYERVTNRIA